MEENKETKFEDIQIQIGTYEVSKDVHVLRYEIITAEEQKDAAESGVTVQELIQMYLEIWK